MPADHSSSRSSLRKLGRWPCVLFALSLRPLQPAEIPNFRNDIIPALTKLGCNGGACHGSQYGKGGFKLSLLGYDVEADYTAIVKDLKGRRVNPVDATDSLILRKPTIAIPHGGGLRFQPRSKTYNLILSWISAGIPGPGPADSLIQALEIPQYSRVMQPTEKQQITVRARYSDMSVRDVTAACRWETLNESVAEVSQDGLIKAKSGGGAAVIARYAGKAGVASIIVPYEGVENYSASPANNYVDELVQAKWKQLGLRPARLTSDTEFIRRVSLDLTGVLPKEQDITAFVSDASVDKRSKLIDRLLETPEYVDFWTLKWGDLLRVTRNGMGAKPMWNFHNWLRNNLQNNRPVDQIVREILLARGQPNREAVSGFYKMANTPEERAEAVSVGFMGIRIGCARCHHHPFEKWGQEDYYGLAAFFARLDSKPDGDYGVRWAEYAGAALRLAPSGFMRNPRTHKVVYPKVPDGDSYGYDGDPRVKLADWLVSKQNAWLPRNFVNRYWGYMLGRGLVEPLDDMRETNPPLIPELLDALADDFVRSGFDQKHMLRVIGNSRVYQLDSAPAAGMPADNPFFTFYVPRRLSAEQLLEAINYATNVPDKFRGLPKGIRPMQLPDPEVGSDFLDLFGRSRRMVPCECSRSNDTNITQVLDLMNGDYLQEKISSPTGRVAALFQLVPPVQVMRNLYYATLSRPPSENELAKASDIVNQSQSSESKKKALEDLLWVLVNSKEFLFNH